jgi:hypothetical protein
VSASASERTAAIDRSGVLARPWIWLAVATVLVWGWPFLAPESLFWDDWLQLANDPLQVYQDNGLPWVGHLIAGLMVAGPWAVKAVTLAATVVTTVAVFHIAGRGLGLSRMQQFLVAVISMVLPLNAAHGSVGVLALYTISLALFAVAWWILTSTAPTAPPSHLRAAGATALFFMSFTTASLLVFIAVPAIHFCFLYRNRAKALWAGVLALALRYWYLPLAPVAFWVLRQTWFAPSATYASYNRLRLPDSWTSPVGAGLILCVLTIAALGVVLLWSASRRPPARLGWLALVIATISAGGFTIFTAWTMGQFGLRSGVVLAALAFATLALAWRAVIGAAELATAVLPLVGLGLMATGMVPYLLVGKIPAFDDWHSRHQLLLPWGMALLIVSAAAPMLGRRLPRTAPMVAIAVAVMAVGSASAPVELAADWRKQEQVIAELDAHREISEFTTVEFRDDASQWNFADRRYRFYEYTAFLRAAFGGETRFGGDSRDVEAALSGALSPIVVNPHMYGVTDWSPDGTRATVSIVDLPGAGFWSLLFGRPTIQLQVEPLS